ncbi:hypothetical protein CR513_37643, partial [Mucuna pruriens]
MVTFDSRGLHEQVASSGPRPCVTTTCIYLLPITCANMILGASWLATLGPYIVDYHALTIKFDLGDTFVTLHGDLPTLPWFAKFHHIKRVTNKHAMDEFFSLQIHHVKITISTSLTVGSDFDLEVYGVRNRARTVVHFADYCKLGEFISAALSPH